jgi:glutathione S-transferase
VRRERNPQIIHAGEQQSMIEACVMGIRLHVFPPSPRSFKVLLAAQVLRLPYELKVVNLGAGEQRKAEFLALNVNQRTPALEHDGYVLWESNAILEYLAAQVPASTLIPAGLQERLTVTKWLYWESAHWDQAAAVFMFERVVKPAFNLGTLSESEIARGTTLMGRIAPVLDGELTRHRYVVGETLTAADLAIAAAFCHADAAQYPLQPYQGIQRWIKDIQTLPAWAEARALQHSPQAR